jgi:ADP-ribose pyrophosphatase YjhB (NUDIX family)
MTYSRTLRFCPDCGEPAFRAESDKSWRCASCDFLLYQNTAAAVAAIIVHRGEILFAVRAGEPQAGKLDLPGGFVDNDESAEEALSRELFEELGLRDLHAGYLVSFPNNYPYAGIVYKTLDLIYLIELSERPLLQPADDVAAVRWIDARHVPYEQIAFESVRRALHHYRINGVRLD